MYIKKLKVFNTIAFLVLAIMIFSYSIITYPQKDMLQYIDTINLYKNLPFEEIKYSPISLLTLSDEIAWKFLLYILSKTFITAEIAAYLIALASFLIIITSIHKFAGVLVTSILFLNPMIQNLVLSQLRSSLVCAILCLALTKSKSKLILLTPFIHYSSYAYLLAMCFSKDLKKYQDLLLYSLFFLIIFAIACYTKLNMPAGIFRESLVNNIPFAFKISLITIPCLSILIWIFKIRGLDYFGSFLIYIILAIIISPFFHIDIVRFYPIALLIMTIYINRSSNSLLKLIFFIYLTFTSLIFYFFNYLILN
jgi:hypothetical protein